MRRFGCRGRTLDPFKRAKVAAEVAKAIKLFIEVSTNNAYTPVLIRFSRTHRMYKSTRAVSNGELVPPTSP